jgi:hypothetical protein
MKRSMSPAPKQSASDRGFLFCDADEMRFIDRTEGNFVTPPICAQDLFAGVEKANDAVGSDVRSARSVRRIREI